MSKAHINVMLTRLTDPPKPNSRQKKNAVTCTLPRELRAIYGPGFVRKSTQERPTHKLTCLQMTDQVVGCKRHFLLVSVEIRKVCRLSRSGNSSGNTLDEMVKLEKDNKSGGIRELQTNCTGSEQAH
jgi:hypothetical protein